MFPWARKTIRDLLVRRSTETRDGERSNEGQWAATLVSLLVIGSILASGIAVMPGAVAPASASSHESAIEITECMDINASGHYVLGSDLTSEGTCLLIDSDGVTIDGAGHTITGTPTSSREHGISTFEDAHHSVVIRNVTVEGWDTEDSAGIDLRTVELGVVENVTAIGNYHGIWLDTLDGINGSHNTTVTNNTVMGSLDDGILLGGAVSSFPSNNNTISNNTVTGSAGTAIRLIGGSSDNHVVGNSITDNGENFGTHGIEVSGGSNNVVEGNVISRNADDSGASSHGISLIQDAENVSILDNEITENDGHGIHLHRAANVTITGNVISNHTDSGIVMGGSSTVAVGTLVSDNEIVLNGQWGVRIQSGSNNNTVSANNVSANGLSLGWQGISLSSAANNTITNNVVTENGAGGIEVRNSQHNALLNNVISDHSEFWYGVRIRDSKGTTLVDNVVHEPDANAVEVRRDSTETIVDNLDIGGSSAANTTVWFTGTTVDLASNGSAPVNPDAQAIGRYFEAEPQADGAYLDITLAYNDADVGEADESTLTLWRFDGGTWTQVPDVVLDTGANVVSANITDFSLFGAFVAGEPANGTITGAVTDADTGAGLEGANVTVLDPDDGTEVANESTVRDGLYTVDIPAGTYDVLFEEDGYVPATEEGIAVGSAETVELDVALVPVVTAGELFGTVTDADSGDPIEGASISVLDGVTPVDGTSTNETGEYQIVLEEGTYTVELSAIGYTEQTFQNVNIAAGGETVQDAALSPQPVIGVNGTVTDAVTGAPLSEVGVVIMVSGIEEDVAITDGNGYYEIELSENTYDVMVAPVGYEMGFESGVVVEEPGFTTVDFALDPVGTGPEGVVSHVNGTTPDMANISVNAFDADGILQIQLQNETADQNDLANRSELAGLGADESTTFEINVSGVGEEPLVLVGAGNVSSWVIEEASDGSYNVSIVVQPIAQESIIDCEAYTGCTPPIDPWPTGDDDAATESLDATVGLAADPLSELPESAIPLLEDMIIATDAQAFGSPVYDNESEELSIFVAGPHLTIDGEPNDGFYRSFLADALLAEWGIEDPESELTAAFEGQPKEFAVEDATGGVWIDVDISYSAGTVTLSATEPANLTVEIVDTNSPVTEGEDLAVTIDIENTGDVSGTQTIELREFGGSAVDSETVSLDAHGSTTITLTWATTDGDGGNGDITVAGANSTATASVEIQVAEEDGPGPEPDPEPAFFDVSIDDANSPVTAGDGLHVDVTIENTGEEAASQPIELTNFDGVVVDTSTVELDVGEADTITLSWATNAGDEGAGEVTVSSTDDDSSVSVTIEPAPTPASFVISIVETSSPVIEGEGLAVTVEIENVGDRVGTATVELSDLDGETAVVETLDLDGGSSESRTLTWATGAGDAGSGTITVTTADSSAEATINVAAAEAIVEIAAVELSATDIVPGDTVEAVATATNVGNVPGELVVDLEIDGTTVATETIELDAGESKSVSVSHTFDAVGEYTVSFGGEVGGTVLVEEADDDEQAAGDDEDDTDGMPGFGIVVALLALLAGGYRIAKRSP